MLWVWISGCVHRLAQSFELASHFSHVHRGMKTAVPFVFTLLALTVVIGPPYVVVNVCGQAIPEVLTGDHRPVSALADHHFDAKVPKLKLK